MRGCPPDFCPTLPRRGRDPSSTPSSSPAAATGACKLNKYRNYKRKVLVSFYSLCIFVPNCFSEFGFKTLEFYGRVRKVSGLCKPVPAGGSGAGAIVEGKQSLALQM